MFEVKGKNRMGMFESIVLDEKGIPEAMLYANKYFKEVFSIRSFKIPYDFNK